MSNKRGGGNKLANNRASRFKVLMKQERLESEMNQAMLLLGKSNSAAGQLLVVLVI